MSRLISPLLKRGALQQQLVKNNIPGIHHGVSKRNLPLFLKEQEYRFNHRNVGLGMLDKIQQYLTKSTPMKKRTIIRTLDDALPIFS